MYISQWSDVLTIIGSISLGLLLLGFCAVYITLFQKDKAEFLWVGILAGLQILISFTSAKECGIILAGKEFFIIAGSLIYPILACGEDYINEFYGKQIAKNALVAQIISRIITTIYMVLLIRIPAPSLSKDNYNAFYELMNILPRIAVSSIIATYIAGLINVTLYSKIKIFTKMKKLWLRSTISTITSSFTNALLFSTLAFWGIKGFDAIMQMVILSVVVRIFTGLAEIPFLYIMRTFHQSIDKYTQKSDYIRK